MADNTETARRLTLAWGVHSIQVPAIKSIDDMRAFACEAAVKEGYATAGEMIIIAAGTPIGVSGTTNTLTILAV
jgi:pyruvate kinase